MYDTLLILLTSTYPYGSGEPFILDELEYATAQNADVLIVAKRSDKTQYYPIPANIKIDKTFTESQRSRMPKSILWFPSIIFHMKEIIANLPKAKGILNKLTYLLFEADQHRYYRALIRLLRKYDVTAYKKIIFYSYWFTNTVAAAIQIKKTAFRERDVSIVTRAHRYDLYESESVLGFFPNRENHIHDIDRIYPVSMDGRKYLLERYTGVSDKIESIYLGTKDRGVGPEKTQDTLHLVSCSRIVPVKRIEEIAKAVLRLFEVLPSGQVPICWTHFGDGPGFNELYEKFNKHNRSGLTIEFKGQCHKEEIMEYYSMTEIDLFLNMSTSEGIPVSIMEAISFGIPVIATDVGGTSEIVVDGYNGRLLPTAATEADLLKAILGFMEQTNEEVQEFRRNARMHWDINFNAEKNYQHFYAQVLSL